MGGQGGERFGQTLDFRIRIAGGRGVLRTLPNILRRVELADLIAFVFKVQFCQVGDLRHTLPVLIVLIILPSHSHPNLLRGLTEIT